MAWYAAMKCRFPAVCDNSEAQKNCPNTCSNVGCFEGMTVSSSVYLGTRVHKFDDQSTVCLARSALFNKWTQCECMHAELPCTAATLCASTGTLRHSTQESQLSLSTSCKSTVSIFCITDTFQLAWKVLTANVRPTSNS